MQILMPVLKWKKFLQVTIAVLSGGFTARLKKDSHGIYGA
jgi:hypothetical protein